MSNVERDPERIRNIALVGQAGVGKTRLVDALLAAAGVEALLEVFARLMPNPLEGNPPPLSAPAAGRR